MTYTINLSLIPLSVYLDMLQSQPLLPSRQALLIDLDARFAAIARQSVATLADLRKHLSTPIKLAAFAQATGVDGEWLNLLRREMGSLESKPLPLSSFPWVGEVLLASLDAEGIHTTRDYFESKRFGTDELSALCDLTRINGVGSAAARTFREAGFATAQAIADATAADLLMQMTAVNDAKGYYRAKLGEKDMQYCIDYARLLVAYAK